MCRSTLRVRIGRNWSSNMRSRDRMNSMNYVSIWRSYSDHKSVPKMLNSMPNAGPMKTRSMNYRVSKRMYRIFTIQSNIREIKYSI